MRTLPEQIAANKRLSLIYAFLLVLILAGLGTAIVGTYAPRYWVFGTVGATLLGAIYAIVAVKGGSSIVLGVSRAREATAAEDLILRNVVEEMALAAGLPMPKVYVIDDAAPNAFATGSDPAHASIAVTTGLLAKLNRDELQGVVAHEMGHIRNYDTRFLTAISLIAGLIPLLADTFIRAQWWTGFSGSRDNDNNSDSNMGGVFQIAGIILAILAPIFAMLLNLAVSRQREFLADATAAELTRYPEGLANALQKIEDDPTPLSVANRATEHLYIVNPMTRKNVSTKFTVTTLPLAGAALDGGPIRKPVTWDLMSTHPSTEARVQALMGLMGQYRH